MDKMAMIYEINELDLFFFKAMANRYKKLDITPVQSRIIMVIASKKDGMYQKEMEDFIPCNKSTLSAILNTMEKNELIKRIDSKIEGKLYFKLPRTRHFSKIERWYNKISFQIKWWAQNWKCFDEI